MTKYAFFLGCTIPNRLPFVESAIRNVFPAFDVELVDLPFGCCPDPTGFQSFNIEAWYTLAARNLCIAEAENLDILTACTGCFETLKVTNTRLKEDSELRYHVNESLKAVDREFRGTIHVKHFSEVLHQDIGPDKIAEKVQTPLTGVRLATHTGCHYSRPSSIMQTDDPERPTHLDDLVEALGAQSIPYLKKTLCCGAGVRGVDSPTSVAISHEKIVSLEQAGADALVTICPTCFVSYDIGQFLMAKQFGHKTKIPVFMYPELLGLTMGLDMRAGFNMHTIKPREFLAQVIA